MSKHRIFNIIFLAASIFILCGVLFWGFSFWGLITLLFIRAGLIVYGSFALRADFFLKSVSRFETTDKVVVISFDDGPTEYTSEVLKLLDKYNAQASFFCIGQQIEKFPDILQQISEKEHSIGNHTYTHSTMLGFFSKNRVKEEIIKTDEIIFRYTGRVPSFFRPPFGVTNPSIAKALKETRHEVIGWNIRSFDTFFKRENDIFNRIIRQIKPGSIILLHDTSEKTVLVLERLLHYLTIKGYRSIGADQIIKNKV